jgi:hypothetical protein
MIRHSQLTTAPLLGNLPLRDFRVDRNALGSAVAHRFRQDASLPGVIVTNGDTVAGVLSRQRFIERMSRPYGPELHLRRPIHLLLPFIEFPSLLLPYTCQIDEAVRRALMRPTDYAYDPIAVVFPNNMFRLLDVRTLILAQSKILEIANQAIRQNELKLQESLETLKQKQAIVQEKNQLLELQKISIEDRNQLLEKQQADLVQKTQEIRDLNRRFIQIGQILSIDGEEAFKATFEGVDTISENTEKMIAIGRSLKEYLETVRDASGLVRKVSHDAHHLATQVSILVNNYGEEFAGFSRIANDIGRLSNQAFEAGQRVDEMTSRLKTRTGDLTQIAKQGAIEARALLVKVARAEQALSELEKLVNQHDKAVFYSQDVPLNSHETGHPVSSSKIESKAIFPDLEDASMRGNTAPLIEEIEKRLKKSQKISLEKAPISNAGSIHLNEKENLNEKETYVLNHFLDE